MIFTFSVREKLYAMFRHSVFNFSKFQINRGKRLANAAIDLHYLDNAITGSKFFKNLRTGSLKLN